MVLVFTASTVFAQNKVIEVPSIPDNIEAFLSLRDSLATTPEGGAAIMITALQMHARNKALGMQAITIAMDSGNLMGGSVYKGYAPSSAIMYHIKRMESLPYVPFAYVQGANPANGYSVSAPLRYNFSRNKYSGDEASGEVKVFVATYGVSARPVRMKRNDKGIWKAFELSSLFVGVQAPPSGKTDDL